MIHFDAHTDTYGPISGMTCHAGASLRLVGEEGLVEPQEACPGPRRR